MGNRGRLATLVAIAIAVVLTFGSGVASAATIPVVPVKFTVTEGQAYSGAVATFFDTNAALTAADFTATISWGDGVSTAATISGSSSAGYTVSPPTAHYYQEEGIYPVGVTVSGSDSGSASQQLTVADAPLASPTTAPQGFSGSGSSGVGTAEAAFKAAIGGVNNGTVPSQQPSGLRSLTWDGIGISSPDPAVATPINAHTAALTASAVQPFGLELASPVAVANDGFASVNPETFGRLAAFTAPNDAAAIGGNTLELDLVAPATTGSTPVPRATRGLGVMFMNVTVPNTTSVSYYDGTALLATAYAPTTATGSPSFVGDLFSNPVVTRVVITLGSAMIFGWDGSTVSPGPADSLSTNLVAADDVVLAEPAAEHADMSATAGVPFSGQVGSFADTDQGLNPPTASDFTAQIDWGDGTFGAASVTGTGPFAVSGGHTYATAGSYSVTVRESDRGGATRLEHFTMVVSAPTGGTTTGGSGGTGSTGTPGSGSGIAPHCTITASSTKLARRARSVGVVVKCDVSTTVTNLTGLATVTAAKSRQKTRLSLGRATGRVAAGRATTLVLTPGSTVLAKLRRAAARHSHISLSFTLNAVNSAATSTATGSLPSLSVAKR